MALLLVSAVASAHDEPGSQKTGTTEPAAEPKKEAAEKERGEPAWEISADVFGGATTADVLSPGRPTRIEQAPLNALDSTRISAYTFLFGLERHLGDRLTVGARAPIVAATLSSRTGISEDRSVVLGGNVELEGAFVLAHGRTWNLVASLGVALPTAGGKEPPTAAEVQADPTKRFEYKRIDTFAAAHGASATLGSYDSALFEPGNLGIVPQIAADIHVSELTITPTLKVENLIDVTGDADETYINEIVAGVRAGFRVTPVFEPGVHVWVRDLHEQAHSGSTTSAVGVVEPFLRFHLGGFKPIVSAILPFAGDLADSKTFAVRAGFIGEL
ncbi:MAG: hypothetical protein NVS3B10_19340 [Polyangiales bacterium]